MEKHDLAETGGSNSSAAQSTKGLTQLLQVFVCFFRGGGVLEISPHLMTRSLSRVVLAGSH